MLNFCSMLLLPSPVKFIVAARHSMPKRRRACNLKKGQSKIVHNTHASCKLDVSCVNMLQNKPFCAAVPPANVLQLTPIAKGTMLGFGELIHSSDVNKKQECNEVMKIEVVQTPAESLIDEPSIIIGDSDEQGKQQQPIKTEEKSEEQEKDEWVLVSL